MSGINKCIARIPSTVYYTAVKRNELDMQQPKYISQNLFAECKTASYRKINPL